MGYTKSKTHHRDEISGLHVHDDAALKNGEFSVDQLRAIAESRQAGINEANRADWSSKMTGDAADQKPEHPAYGNAGSRLPRPSDNVVGSKSERFGSSAENDSDSTKGGAPQKPSKQPGIEQPKKRG